MKTNTYHHGSLRTALVDAAEEVVRESGPGALTVRSLARQVGVSHNAAYRHFEDRADLAAELARRVMGRLVDSMRARQAEVLPGDPVLVARRRLAETGRAYVHFALAEPGLFQLAFSSYSALMEPGEHLPPDKDPYALLGSALDDLVLVGFLASEARIDAEVTCWSAVHGLCVLTIDGATREPDVPIDVVLDRVLIAIDRSYAATTGSVVSADDIRSR